MNKLNWEISKLGDLCIFEKKSNFKKNLPYVGLEHIEANTGKFIGSENSQSMKSLTFYFNMNHVLYGRLRPYLNKALIPSFEGHCSTEIFPIKPNDNLNKKFLFYWLTSHETVKKINITCTGTRMPRANMNELLEFEFPLPPLSEQKHIVAILDKAFSAIEQAKENIAKNLKSSHDIFAKYLHNIFHVQNSVWNTKPLGEIVKLEYGKPLPDYKRKQDGKYPVYGANGEKSRTDDYYHAQKSIIVGRKGSAGELNFTEAKFWPLDVTYFIKFNSDKYDLNFIYYLLKSLCLPKLAKGVKPGINRNEVYAIKVSTPSFSEQKKIVSKLDAIYSQTQRLESIYLQKLANLEELKKSILNKAFNGELSEVDSLIEEVHA